jgi:mannose-6-phosphate isomerase-like protein (cupin superfamily)
VRARKRPNAAGRDKVGDVHEFDFAAVQRRLAAETGGYEIVHESPGLEVGVYVLVAPEPDRQQPHEHDEIYVVLEGRGTLMVEGEAAELGQGDAIFVAAGAEHRFTGYEGLSLLVIFDKHGRGTPNPGA